MLKLQARGQATALDRRPKLFPDVEPIWSAFCALSGARQGGLEPLNLLTVYAWLDEHAVLDPVDRGEWVSLLYSLDSSWLRRMRARQAEQTPARR